MYRFAFDIGASSIGWAVYALDEKGRLTDLRRLGVRIFPTGREPQSKESNAAARRGPRQQRGQIDRRISRRKELFEKLKAFGLWPTNGLLDTADWSSKKLADYGVKSRSDTGCEPTVFDLDPYAARARAAKQRVELPELGRAIWHISKHRGFKSNRKTDRANSDTGKIASASSQLEQYLKASDYPTYGAWLNARRKRGETVRVRPYGRGAAFSYEFYPVRAMLEAEFDLLWKEQAGFHSELTDEARDSIRDAVFWQRPLKPVDPGRCTFFPEQPRVPKWQPIAQEFLILQQVNSLRLLEADGERPLSLYARDLIARHLMAGEKLTWKGVRRLLGLSYTVEINLENGGLKELSHNVVAAQFRGTKRKPGPLAADWECMAGAKRLALLQILDESLDTEETVKRLVSEAGLAGNVAGKVEKISLPDGHLKICAHAAHAIVRALREEVIPYSRAVERASENGYFGGNAIVHHSDLRGDEVYDRLPPYNRVPALQRMIGNGSGNPDDPDLVRYGRITNPTVHIALGQFRRVMNAMLAEYGRPAEIVIETARDMSKSAAQLNEIDRSIKSNRKRNDKRRNELEQAGLLAPGQRVGDRLLRMRLWEELGTGPADRVCPYSGQPIALHQLFSEAVEVDHILPFEDTFDDGPANKTVCFREWNRRKQKRAPGDAWSGAELDAIIARVKAAPGMSRKSWRFLPDAMEKWQGERGFEDRQLHATGYLARIARAYAETLYPKDGTSSVWVLPGRMTAMLRRRWGLHLPDHNAKTRLDHRHHALDAAIIGVIDRSMVQRLQTLARQHSAEGLDRLLPDLPEPLEGFRVQVLKRIAELHVSHRPNRSASGRLQEDTAYGLVRPVPENESARAIGNVVRRKAVVELREGEIGKIRDERLRAQFVEATQNVCGDRKALGERLAQWSKESGHRRVRILKPEAQARAVRDANGKNYKWLVPGEVAWVDVLEAPDGRWFPHATDIWSANAGVMKPWQDSHSEARFVMRLHKNDTVQLFDLDGQGELISGSNRIKRVVRLEPSAKRVRLAGIEQAGVFDKRQKDPDDAFDWDQAAISRLKQRRARRVRIDELGRVRTVPHGKV